MEKFKLTAQKISEQAREVQILAYLSRLLRWLAWKHDSVGIYDEKRKAYRTNHHPYRIPGVSDAHAVIPPNGRLLVVEIKTPEVKKYILKHYEMLTNYWGPDKDKTRYRNQIHFIENVKRSGGIGFFADSVDDVQAQLKELGIIP